MSFPRKIAMVTILRIAEHRIEIGAAMINTTALAHLPRTRLTMRVRLKHPAEFIAHVVTIESDELSGWIAHAERHGFAIVAEAVDPSPQAA